MIAFLAGWGIEAVVGIIPYVSGTVFAEAAIFGLGAAAVAHLARGRRAGGRARQGSVGPARSPRGRSRPGAGGSRSVTLVSRRPGAA